ncbi:MAG: helix-turn-helix domain-containing protein [Bradymonadaceae bacterium]
MEHDPDRALAIVGENVRRWRQEEGLTQEELAFSAGIDRSYLGHLESGGMNILFALAEALGVEPSMLLQMSEQDGGNSSNES